MSEAEEQKTEAAAAEILKVPLAISDVRMAVNAAESFRPIPKGIRLALRSVAAEFAGLLQKGGGPQCVLDVQRGALFGWFGQTLEELRTHENTSLGSDFAISRIVSAINAAEKRAAEITEEVLASVPAKGGGDAG